MCAFLWRLNTHLATAITLEILAYNPILYFLAWSDRLLVQLYYPLCQHRGFLGRHSKGKGRSRRIRKGVRISACPAIRLLRRAASTAARAVPPRTVQPPLEPSSGLRASHGSEETSRRTSERGDAKPAWEKQVLSARGFKRVGRHSEYAI